MLYEVSVKCGHVGKGKYVDKIFAVNADSGKEAAALARWIPRVKHHHKDAITYVREIDKNRYMEIELANSIDPYLQCTSIQEQRQMTDLDIQYEIEDKPSRKREPSRKDVYYGKVRLRNPKSRNNNYCFDRSIAI